MADFIVSAVAERLRTIRPEQVNLVRGVDVAVQSLSNELKRTAYVLNDAESRRLKETSVNNWLSRLEHTSYELEDVLDEWNYAILKHQMEHQSKQKVCSFFPSSCLRFKKDVAPHDIAKKIQNVKAKLDLILAEKDRYDFVKFITYPTTDLSSELRPIQSTPFIDSPAIHGREPDRKFLVSKLMANGGSQEELGIHILSIVGTGGLGKTTLAQLVYNDSQVEKSFELRIWVCVSDPFDEVGIAKGIIQSVRNGSCPDTNELEMLLLYLRDSISGKKFLLVLDDVWTEDDNKWEPLKYSLKYGEAGSTILVTTRNERVAKMMGSWDNEIYRLGQLSDEDCLSVLCPKALVERNHGEEFEKFQDIGKKIVKKCKGMPLFANVLVGLLRFKNSLEEWKNVLNNEIWQLKAKVELFPHLLLSYNELSPVLKRCFSYCAVFPKDYKIDVDKLIENWMAVGYLSSNNGNAGDMELRGQEYFEILAMRSLFQDFQRSGLDGPIKMCKMHDKIHDFAQSLRKNGSAEATGMKKKTCKDCDPLLVSSVKEYRSIIWDNKHPPKLCDCVTNVRVVGITNCNLGSIPQKMENLIQLRWLDFSYTEFSRGDLKTICKLYNLQSLRLKHCELQEIPTEIGNLIHLRHLDLSFNKSIKELPDSICDLHELLTLNVVACSNLCGLPKQIDGLKNLKHLLNRDTSSLKLFPQGLAQLTSLHTLNVFCGGSGWSKLVWLKNLNCLHGSLKLWIRLTNDWKDMVKDAREADLMKKKHIQNLEIIFFDYMDEKDSSVRMHVMEALKPHTNLRNLEIRNYMGSKLPGWIASPSNQIRCIKLHGFNHVCSLPPLGKLPCLEEICMSGMYGLQLVGREFLGLETTTATAARDIDVESSSSTSSASTVGFPKLKKLTFRCCPHWKEWEDITADEEKSAAVSLMPCLKELSIQFCKGLRGLPHRLLRKASLEVLELQQHYGDNDGSDWKIHIAKPTPPA